MKTLQNMRVRIFWLVSTESLNNNNFNIKALTAKIFLVISYRDKCAKIEKLRSHDGLITLWPTVMTFIWDKNVPYLSLNLFNLKKHENVAKYEGTNILLVSTET